MTPSPLVSCIIIFLDEARFIREAIESILAQTYTEWELILVDDGSTDASREIAQQYAADNKGKIYYVDHDGHANLGMSQSRNLGIQHARGSYIAYLDGDDIWLEDKLEEQVQLARENPEAIMVYGPLRRWYSWTGNPGDELMEDLYGVGKDQVHPYADSVMQPPVLMKMILEDIYYIPGGILIKKEAYNTLGGYEPQFRGMYEDAVFLSKVLLKYPIYVSSKWWYKYRMHPDSCTHQSSQRRDSQITKRYYLDWLGSYMGTSGVSDAGLLEAFEFARKKNRKDARRLRIKGFFLDLKESIRSVGQSILPDGFRKHAWSMWLRVRPILIRSR